MSEVTDNISKSAREACAGEDLSEWLQTLTPLVALPELTQTTR